MTMRKKNWRTKTTCVILFVLVLAFQIKYSSIVRSKLTHAHKKANPVPEIKQLEVTELESNPSEQSPPTKRQISCDRSHYHYDICTIHVATVLDPTISTFFIQHRTTVDPNPTAMKIRPYPRKFDSIAMSRIKELTITSGAPIPSCHVMHESPAMVFSAGGYTGNFFHEFNDGFIPLFITLNSLFHRQDDGDVVLVISKARDWWVSKYANLLGQFSKHPIVDLDNDNATHCFPSATLGLVSHGFMTIKPELIPNSKSLHHFHAFLSKAYDANNVPFNSPPQNARPRLVLVNRSSGDGRLLLNLEEVKLEIERVGFDVVMFEPKPSTPLDKAFALIGSSHAMVGIHGAALTHLLFLKPGSLFIQVVPLGLELVAELCFGNPARGMGLDYREYKIRVEESSLIEKYSKEDMMIKDPVAFLSGKPWSKSTMDIYLKEQNVRLDLVRFRKYLKKAYNKARLFI
ncbi:alpha-1,3-arabinosyltransferase XAT3-like [Abrus precatorius]|uniref:Alpha-1,3-arabinosyltransferase XAT3-like n=1 Tax=Abrus precatorius TaxID=3816 RepID=A0A8B8M2L9_ABRPR|nr:alpha-1,3-arabinosyltransferase XAT3-like [Abrus precatorius]